MSETNPERPATPTPLARERLATEIRRLAVVLDAEAIAVAGTSSSRSSSRRRC